MSVPDAKTSPADIHDKEHKGVRWLDLAASDSGVVPTYLTDNSYKYLGSDPVDPKRFTSEEFFRKEIDLMWPNVWQMAVREEEIPNVGDVTVYDNAGRSYVVVRQQDGSVRAFHNVCLHRARRLRSADGAGIKDFTCPFHGWAWNIDGSLKEIPCSWDFPALEGKNMDLPEAEVGRWGGFVFIRENPGGMSLDEYITPLQEQFARWNFAGRKTTKWVGRIIDANWKACREAFGESYHVWKTHPQLVPFTADVNSSQAIFSDHVSLMITPAGTPSPHVADRNYDQDTVLQQLLKANNRIIESGTELRVTEGSTARQTLGNYVRERFKQNSDQDYSSATDSELLDSYVYHLFPNLSPWGGYNASVLFRWRPWPDHKRTLMDIRFLSPARDVGENVGRPKMELVQPGETLQDYLGTFGAIVEQDVGNLVEVQHGMEVSKTGTMYFADYQEVGLRQFHATIDKYVEGRLP